MLTSFAKLEAVKNRSVYMRFSTDILHSGHIGIIKKAVHLGKLTIVAPFDDAVASYKHFPLLPFEKSSDEALCLLEVSTTIFR